MCLCVGVWVCACVCVLSKIKKYIKKRGEKRKYVSIYVCECVEQRSVERIEKNEKMKRKRCKFLKSVVEAF